MEEHYDGDASFEGTGAAYVEYEDHAEGGKSAPASCLIMCIGCLLFPGALALVGWNERNYACKSNIILEAEESAFVASCGDTSGAEGKLTFFSCPIDDASLQSFTPSSTFNVPGLGGTVKIDSVAAAQNVEMYQCIETKEEKTTEKAAESSFVEFHQSRKAIKHEEMQKTNLSLVRRMHKKSTGGSLEPDEDTDEKPEKETTTATKYYYKMAWADTWYNSREYKATPTNIKNNGCPDFVVDGKINHNPSPPNRGDGHPIELGRQDAYATSVVAGGFTFSDAANIKKFKAEQVLSMVPFASQFALPTTTDNIVSLIGKSTLAVHTEKPKYLASCRSERLGCIQLQYFKSNSSHMAAFGLAGGSGVISPFKAKEGWGCPAADFIRMWPKEMTKDQAIADLRSELSATTWIFRIGGVLLAWFALYCCFDPIASGVDMIGNGLSYIPCVGGWLESALEGVVTMFLCLISCSIGVSCALFVIAIMWLAMRPIIGGPLLASVLLLCLVGYCAGKRSKRDPKYMRKYKEAQQQPLQQRQDTATVEADMGFNQ
jgi:hypothetical protein